MRITLDIPDALFRRSAAAAALAGVTLGEFVANALRACLTHHRCVTQERSGWRAVFGRAPADEVAEVDRIISQELGQVVPGSWS